MSNEKKLFAVSALFDTPDEIIAAAAKVAERNYQNWDVNTPYPVHGMDDAMNLSPSKLAWVTFAMSTFGACFAMFFMWWVMANDYPLVIGGKPFFSIPAFVPITFALGVLLSVTTTVFAMIVFFCRLPGHSHPVHDTAYIKAVVSDKFGVYVEANNKGFDKEEVTAFLKSIGASKIIDIFHPEEKPLTVTLPGGVKVQYLDVIFLLVLGGVISGVLAKTYVFYNQIIYDRVPIIHAPEPITGLQLVYFQDTTGGVEDNEAELKFYNAADTANGIISQLKGPYSWLDVQPKENQTTKSKFFADQRVLRPQVEETVPRGFMPYAYEGQPLVAEKEMANPIPISPEALSEGQKYFNIYCTVCHGDFGDGDGRLNGQFPKPPSLHSEKLAKAGDGLIYHIITNGQNVMPAYDKQIDRETRWKVIHYIRSLQRAKNAKDTDLK